MHCPGIHYNLKPYYWGDPDTKKRHKLNLYHLTALIKYIEQGNELRIQSDMP